MLTSAETGSTDAECQGYADGGFTVSLGSHQSELTIAYDGLLGVTLTADQSTFASYGTGTITVNINHPTVGTDKIWSFNYEALNTYCPTELSTTYDTWIIELNAVAPR